MEKTKCILPCAGFGTRVGMEPNESKELLPWGPNGQKLIDHKLDLCVKYNLDPVIITRPEKYDLQDYLCRENDMWLKCPGAMYIEYSPTGEWAKTLHDNRRYFGKNNILMLPDTIFDEKALKELIESNHYYSFAVHEVTDPEKWGVLYHNYLYEKPKIELPGQKFSAWGLIKFNDELGRKLFRELDEKKYFKLDSPVNVVWMDYFEDVTR